MALEEQPPVAVFVFSGKRKSGKDYVSSLLQKRFGEDNCAIFRLSAPLKEQYAKENDLDYAKLLDASEYKEKYREDMIKWGEEKRNNDPGFFCRCATSGDEARKPVWIVSDARRHSDMTYFREKYGARVHTVRIKADDNVREERGFTFKPGIDDAESECGCDQGVDWDIVIYNNGDSAALENKLALIIEDVQDKLPKKIIAV